MRQGRKVWKGWILGLRASGGESGDGRGRRIDWCYGQRVGCIPREDFSC
jgi:hypothetical protein